MILVDTSIWIDHLHRADPALVKRLERSSVCTHPMVIGEIALGSLHDRGTVLGLLRALPLTMVAMATEVMGFVEDRALYGIGLSLVDAHLLAAAVLTPDTDIWTRDRRLAAAANQLGVAAPAREE